MGTNGEGVGTGVGGGRPGVMDGVDVGGGGPAHAPAAQTESVSATMRLSKHAVPTAVMTSGDGPAPTQHCVKEAVHWLTATPSAVKLARSAASAAPIVHVIVRKEQTPEGVTDGDAPIDGVAVSAVGLAGGDGDTDSVHPRSVGK